MPKQKYKHKLEEGCPYQQLYNCSLRSVQRYSRANYPLDDTEQTRALIAAQKYQPPGHEAQQPVTDRAEDGTEPRDVARTASLGLSAAIDRLREAEADAHAEMQQARTPAEKTAAAKRWTTVVKELRDTEKSNPDIEESNKQTVKIGDVQSTLNELFQRLRQDLDTLPNRIARELIDRDEIAIRQVLQTETEQIISSLYNNKYLEQG